MQACPKVTGTNMPQDLEERWFAGVHSDVGGGYPIDIDAKHPPQFAGMWRVPFDWILNGARANGLSIDDRRLAKVVHSTPARNDPQRIAQHESLTGAWWIAEYFPKQVWSSATRSDEWAIGRGRHRTLPEGCLIDASVLERIRDDQSHYAPPNMTKAFLDRVRALQNLPACLPYQP